MKVRALNYFVIGLLGIIFLLSFNGNFAPRKAAGWLACYEKSNNTLHFQGLNKRQKHKGACVGQTQFKVSQSLGLIENAGLESGFSEHRAGTKRTVLLNNGRRLSVSQWAGKTGENHVLVLEPNLNTKKVKQHCHLKNFGQSFSTKYDRKTKSLLVAVKSDEKPGTQLAWRRCSI